MYYDGELFLDEADQCLTCEHFNKGMACPLLEALTTGVVQLQMEVTVTNCGFYKAFIRHLSVIKSA